MTERPWSADPAAYFSEHGYLPVAKLVPAELVGFLDRCIRRQVHEGVDGGLEVDATQVPGAVAVYGSPMFDSLLADLGPDLSAVLGIELVPTYSFFRGYRLGMELTPHTDRPSCEISLSLHLGSDDGADWPLRLQDHQGINVAVSMRPGDAVVYRGCEVPHWREPSPSHGYRQVFLHYVDARGPYSSFRYDRRAGLGRPTVRGPGSDDQRAEAGREEPPPASS